MQVLDLREPLRRAKAERRVYHRTDTHWNEAGAFVVYTENLRALKPWFPDMNAEPRAADVVVLAGAGRRLRRQDRRDRRHRDRLDHRVRSRVEVSPRNR